MEKPDYRLGCRECGDARRAPGRAGTRADSAAVGSAPGRQDDPAGPGAAGHAAAGTALSTLAASVVPATRAPIFAHAGSRPVWRYLRQRRRLANAVAGRILYASRGEVLLNSPDIYREVTARPADGVQDDGVIDHIVFVRAI